MNEALTDACKAGHHGCDGSDAPGKILMVGNDIVSHFGGSTMEDASVPLRAATGLLVARACDSSLLPRSESHCRCTSRFILRRRLRHGVPLHVA